MEVPANANMGCNLIAFPPRSPSLPHCGPMQTAMLFDQIGRFTRAAEEGRHNISQARGEITDIMPTPGVFRDFSVFSRLRMCLVLLVGAVLATERDFVLRIFHIR